MVWAYISVIEHPGSEDSSGHIFDVLIKKTKTAGSGVLIRYTVQINSEDAQKKEEWYFVEAKE